MTQICQFTALPYRLKPSLRRRTVALQIRDGVLTVLAPSGVAKQQIDHFIQQKQHWVLRHLQVQQLAAQSPDYLMAALLPLLDEKLQLKVVIDSVSAVSRDGQTLWLQLSSRITAKNRRQKQLALLSAWYQQQAQHWFEARVMYWQQIMQVQATAVVIKNWQSKWGSCNNKGLLSFNWRLLLAPAWVADYVVVHELAHLTHMDHSSAFWQRVAQFYPEFKQAKQWFKLHQHLLQLN